MPSGKRRWLSRKIIVKVQWAHLDLESGGAVIFHTRQKVEDWISRQGHRLSPLEPPMHRSAMVRRVVIEMPWKVYKTYDRKGRES